jgi:hypothetical protein
LAGLGRMWVIMSKFTSAISPALFHFRTRLMRRQLAAGIAPPKIRDCKLNLIGASWLL